MALPDATVPGRSRSGTPGAAAPICRRARSPATARSCAPTRRVASADLDRKPWDDLPDARRARQPHRILDRWPRRRSRARRSVRLAPPLARDRRRRRPPSTRTCSGWTARAASWSSSTGSSIRSTSGSTTTRATGSTSTSCSRDRRASGARPTYRAVGYEYYFHGYRLETDRPVRVADRGRPGDARRTIRWSSSAGTGARSGGRATQSGGSYPWPAAYPGAGGGVGPFAVADDTRAPGANPRARALRHRHAARAGAARYARPPGAVVAEAAVLRRAAARVRQPAARRSVRRREAAAAAGAPPRMERDRIAPALGGHGRSSTLNSPSSPELGINPDGVSAVHP